MTDLDPSALARAFIADETDPGSRKRFWTMNHHRLGPIAGKVAKAVEPSERVAFYRFYMQRSGGFPPVPNGDIPLLLEAYRLLLDDIDELGANHMMTRLASLYMFGFDETGELADGVLDDAGTLKARTKSLTQVGKYTSLPAQRDKMDKFRPFAGEAPRLLQALRHLDYVHDRERAEHFGVVDLDLWGMILIVLLNPATRTDYLRAVLESEALPDRVQYLGILHKTVRAVMAGENGIDTEFAELASELFTGEMARRNDTQTAELVRKLGLDLSDDVEWEISISIAEKGSGLTPHLHPNMRLNIRPEPDAQWRLAFTHSGSGRFSQDDRKTYQNDPGIEPLSRLAEFPTWLTTIADTHGIVFDATEASVLAGRRRSVVKRIERWIQGEP